MTITSYSEKEQIFIETGLHELTARLIKTFIPRASSNRSFFVNDIPADLTIASNLQMFATVLSGLLSAVVTHAKDSCIRLSAKTYGNVVMLELKEATSCDTFAVKSEVSKLQPIAEKMFGAVSVNNLHKSLTSIRFGFVNLSMID